jgi:hypothetical protein
LGEDVLPIWDGKKACKNLIVISEQGIGDEIFYIRVINQVQLKVEKLSVMVDKRLIGIFTRSFPTVNFLEKDNNLDCSEFDAQISIGSLAAIMKIHLLTEKNSNKPYLICNQGLSDQIKKTFLFSDKYVSGISWRSSNLKIGKQKSINLTELDEIFQTINCEFINLQYGNIADEVIAAERVAGIKLKQVGDIDLFLDIDSLLSIINLCDIVITTSNVTAHLAGAIGKKTLLLLPYAQGRVWYWHQEKINTWYPSIKQFFQDSDLAWGSTINEIVKEFRAEIDRKN